MFRQSVRRAHGKAGHRRGLEGPADRTEGREAVGTILWSEGTVHVEADRFLRQHDGSGTQRTYAYLLVDHLRWLERECLAFGAVELRDLERYTNLRFQDRRIADLEAQLADPGSAT